MNENLTIVLDPSSGISLQAQIRQSIVELILNYSILPGDKLPSSRMLSQQLKVSRNTVILAYQALVDTGPYRQAPDRQESPYCVILLAAATTSGLMVICPPAKSNN